MLSTPMKISRRKNNKKYSYYIMMYKSAKSAKEASVLTRAITAFARNRYYSESRREEILRAITFETGIKMTTWKAYRTIIRYAFGRVSEWGEDLKRLTMAWLQLGRYWFRRLFKFVRANMHLYRFGRDVALTPVF